MEHCMEFTPDFFQDLIKETDPGVTISTIEVKTGAGRGDNYTSMLYRVRADGSTSSLQPWTKSFICKCLPANRARREAFKSEMLFRNEVAFYTRSLPALLSFQASRGHVVFDEVPKVYLAKSHIIVLEDMKEEGFTMTDRKVPLDLQHCELLLRTLGHFHGVSLALKKSAPNIFQMEVATQIEECLFREEFEAWYEKYYRRAGENALSMLKDAMNREPNSEKYLRRFEKFMDTGFFRRMINLVKPSDNKLATLCHGDCWTNNFLFQYKKEGSISKVCMVDFQFARYASPAIDLVQLLFICTTQALRSAHLNSLLLIYSKALYGSLQLLGCSSNFDDDAALLTSIKSEITRCSQVGLGLAVDMIPICNCDSDEAPDLYLHEQSSAENEQTILSSSEVCRVRMADLVVELVDAEII